MHFSDHLSLFGEGGLKSFSAYEERGGDSSKVLGKG